MYAMHPRVQLGLPLPQIGEREKIIGSRALQMSLLHTLWFALSFERMVLVSMMANETSSCCDTYISLLHHIIIRDSQMLLINSCKRIRIS